MKLIILFFLIVNIFGIDIEYSFNNKIVNTLELLNDGYGIEKNMNGNFSFLFEMKEIEKYNLKFKILKNQENELLKQSKWVNDKYYNHIICSIPSYYEYYIEKNEIEIEIKFQETDKYSFYIFKCSNDNINIKFNFKIFIKQKNHLSIELEYNPNIYLILMIIYFILFFIWTSYLIKYYDFIYKLQRILWITLFFKFIEMLNNYSYFILISLHGNISFILSFFRNIIISLNDTLFLILLVLTCLGYGISRESLSLREKQLLGASFLLFFGFKFLYSFCNDPSICYAYILGYKIVKYLITFSMILSLNTLIESFQSNDLMVQNENYFKLEMFKLFRWFFLIYLLLPILFIFIEIIILDWKQDYFILLFNELNSFIIYFSIFISFFPKRILFN